jgi:hypothetical protein
VLNIGLVEGVVACSDAAMVRGASFFGNEKLKIDQQG